METRKHGPVLNSTRLTNSSEVPVDYTKMVGEVLSNHFGETLARLEKKLKVIFSWHVEGRIFSDEIVIAASLLPNTGITATTGYCSVDFDPKASQPTAEESLSLCVDALGSLFDALLGTENAKNESALLSDSLSSFDNIPLEWSEIQIQKKRVFVKFDRANPKLDHAATDWLKKHDRNFEDLEDEFEEDASELFVKGPREQREEDEESEDDQ